MWCSSLASHVLDDHPDTQLGLCVPTVLEALRAEFAGSEISVPTARLALIGRDPVRAVRPGLVELWVGASCAERDAGATVLLVGERHAITVGDPRLAEVVIEPGHVGALDAGGRS